MQRPRFRLRTLMAAVAGAALAFLLVIWARESGRHRSIAAYYAVREANNRRMAATQSQLIRNRTRLIALTEGLLAGEEGRDPRRAAAYRGDLARERETLADNRKEEEAMGRRIRYFVEMRRKHERAARYPWLPVEPDSPEPR
jgi:hypothetical protein